VKVTGVRVRLVTGREEKLKAFATIILDESFIIRELKVISGQHGLFVAMPNRKLTARCPKCGGRNNVTASYCNRCGEKLHPRELPRRPHSVRPKLHMDIAHPIKQECRDEIQKAVITEYQHEIERSRPAEGGEPLEDAGPEGDFGREEQESLGESVPEDEGR